MHHKPLLAVLIVSLTSSFVNAYNERYTLGEVKEIIEKHGFATMEQFENGSISEGFFPEIEWFDEETRANYNVVLDKFTSIKNLITTLLDNWSPNIDENGMQTPIEITHHSDGTELYFDEGLWLIFDRDNTLNYMKHWDHYGTQSDAYRAVLEGIQDFDARSEHTFYFTPVFDGHIVM